MTEWVQKSVPFHLRVSELTLLTVRRTLAVRNFGLTGEALAEDPKSILRSQPSEIRGLLLRSYAIDEALPTLSSSGELIRYVPQQYRRYFIDLTMSFDEYERKFSSKSRSTLRRKERRFAKASGGDIDWREYRTPGEIGVFFPLAREISQHTYQERLLDAGLPDTQDFQEQLRRAAEDDAVRGYILFLEERPVAYLYCPVETGVLHYSYLGYLPDPEIAELSPGTVLLWKVVRNLMDEGGYRIFDFTEGGDHRRRDQKAFFATSHLRCADIFYLKMTPYNVGLVCAHAGLDKSSQLIGDLLERFGLRGPIRKVLRRVRGVG